MKKKEVQLPFGFQNKALEEFFATKKGILLSNWITQGMLYMNTWERIYRLFLEGVFVSFFYFLLQNYLPTVLNSIFSFLIVHTLFWVLNGHFFVLMRYLREMHFEPNWFFGYIKELNQEVQGKEYLLGALAFGSLSKGKFDSASDFDLRFVKRRGFLNAIFAFNFCAWQRIKAFFSQFPLDIYVFDLNELASKIKNDEPPVILFDPDNIFQEHYRDSNTSFSEFCKKFEENYVG